MSTDQVEGHPTPPLLEVVVLHARDVAGAHDGGADRLFVVAHLDAADDGRGDGRGDGGLSVEPATLSGVCKETDLPVRAMLRLSDSFTTTAAELARLVALAQDYLAVGAEGVSFGFLDQDLNIDVEVCTRLCEDLADQVGKVPWTFHHAVDASLETSHAWRQLQTLPGLDAVLSAGSVRGLGAGHEELTERAAADPGIARLLMAGGGLRGEHVPWLVRAGVRQFQVATSVRPGGSWKSHVEAGHVRAWRMLLDDASDLAAGRPAG